MVKIDQNSGGQDLTQSVKLSNGSCSAETTQAVLKKKGRSHHAPEVSSTNGSNLPVNGIPLRNGKCNNHLEKSKKTLNGYSKNVAANVAPIINSNSDVLVNDEILVNSNSENVLVNNEIILNGNSENVSVNEEITGNGNSENVSVNDGPTVNGSSGDNSSVDLPMLNLNCIDEGNGNSPNSSNTSSESESSSNVRASDSLYNEGTSNDDLNGYKKVQNRRRKNKNKINKQQKFRSNRPPGLNAPAIAHDKRNDKKLAEKTSPTHLSQKPPTVNNSAIRVPEKSYSSALLNGQTGNSQLRNGVSNGFSDTPNATKCVNKSSNNCDVPGTRTSVGHLPTDAAKSAVTNGIAVRCKQNNASTTAEMTNVPTRADVRLEKEISPSQKKCLSSCEQVSRESEKSSSLIDSVDTASSTTADCESVLSNDSGRGDSEVPYDEPRPYYCIFPQDKVGKLIGKHGSFKNEVEEQSGCRFWVPKNGSLDKDTTIIQFIGTGAQIEKAKELIKARFPQAPLTQWIDPQEQWLNNGPPLSDNFSPTLPVGTDFMGVVSCIFTPHYFWLQQYGHPVFHPLEDLEQRMSNHFNTVVDAPSVVNPMIGNVVAVPVIVEGKDVKWVRGEIVYMIPESGNIIARYLDHGGEYEVPASEIRPMRHEFLSIPFFASKCSLCGIIPAAGEEWSELACAEFKRLCSNKYHPPLVKVIFKAADIYYVSILGCDDETNLRVDVAETLIIKGLAQFSCKFFQPPEPAIELPPL